MARSTSLIVRGLLLALSLLFCSAAWATTYVRVADQDLTAQAAVIVEAEVVSVRESTVSGKPATEYQMAAQEVIAGDLSGSSFIVRVLGGRGANGAYLKIFGAPEFSAASRVLLFLKPATDGSYRVLHLMQGAFYIGEKDSRKLAFRYFGSSAAEMSLPGRKALPRETARDLETFKAWIRDQRQGNSRDADYRLDDATVEAWLSSKFSLLRITQTNTPTRWTRFPGSVGWRAHQSGQPGLASGGFAEFQQAISVWNNDGGSNINYRYLGTTGATGSFGDGVNTIVFDNLNNVGDFDSPFNCQSGGVIAQGGPLVFLGSQNSHVHNGTTYHNIQEVDIVTNAGIDCLFGGSPWISQQRRAAEVFAHELGHTLGLGHSCGDSGSSCAGNPSLNDALMRAQAHGDNRGARLSADDRAGAAFLYGVAVTAPNAPSNLIASSPAPTQVILTWNDNSNNESLFRIERHTNGLFQEIARVGANVRTFADNSVSSGITYTYQVRASNSGGFSGYSNQAVVRPSGEPPPSNLLAVALSSEQIRLTWQDNSSEENGFEVELRDLGGFRQVLTLPANSTSATLGGLVPTLSYTARVRSTSSEGNSAYSNQASATTLTPAPTPCVADAESMCLNQGRFKVQALWRDFDGNEGRGTVVPGGSDDSALFWFFDADNWEVLVKTLNACGVNQHFWLFSAATTNVEYILWVTDSLTGDTSVYFNPLGNSASAITDTSAFQTCSANASTAGSQANLEPPRVRHRSIPELKIGDATFSSSSVAKMGDCTANDTRLCLNAERFDVQVEWRDFEGNTGSGQVVPLGSDDSGLFWFFNANNWEMLVKVLRGCGINQHYWVFSAATTNVEYTLTVTDTQTGDSKQYFNPLGVAAPAVTDTEALSTCP